MFKVKESESRAKKWQEATILDVREAVCLGDNACM